MINFFRYVVVVGLTLVGRQCFAQEAFAGSWDVVAAEDAPWVKTTSGLKPHPEAMLKNARISFLKNQVVAPGWMGCRATRYAIEALDFDSLFEGGLLDPEHGLNDPGALAHRLGFKEQPVKSLSTGCSEVQFHLVDASTVVFGLNNMIYTLKRHQQ